MRHTGWDVVFDIPGEFYDVAYQKSRWSTTQMSALWNAASVEQFLKLVGEFKVSEESALGLAVWCLLVYSQSLWVGPEPTAGEQAEYPKAFADVSAASTLSCEGELVESLIGFPGALYIGRELLSHICTESLPQRWWLARSALMQHRSLAGGIELCECLSLKQEVINNYIGTLQVLQILPNEHTILDSENREYSIKTDVTKFGKEELNSFDTERLLIETLNALTYYGFGNFFREFLEKECEVWPYSIELTGRRGFRRVHQKDAVAQLCISVRRCTSKTLCDTPFPRQTEVPRDIGLSDIDATNDILPRPKYVDEDEAPSLLSLIEKFYLLAWANEQLSKGTVDDDIAMSVISSLTAEVLRTPHQSAHPLEAITTMEADADWCLWGNALYTRSRAEFNRPKTRERSCLQILALEEQVMRSTPSVCDRLRSLWLTQYPNKWELRRDVGRKFREMGAPLTARDMYAKMHMWTEVIECLVAVDRKNEARELIDEQLLINPDSPTLWFLRGQVALDKHIEYYLKSWDLSNMRYYKATNALAHHYLKEASNHSKEASERKDAIASALKYFEHTVALKPHLIKTQFTYGCLLMEQNMHSEALSAFNAVLLHESTENYQVWANMGAIHCKLKNWVSAMKCFQQAARLAQNKWRIWDSCIKVCFVLGDSLGALEGLGKMVELSCADQIEVWMLERLVSDVAKRMAEATPAAVSQAHFSQRVALFFKEYFLKLTAPLPSRRNWSHVETVFDNEQVIVSLDRFQIWLSLSDLLHGPQECLQICSQYLREVSRVLEDCLCNECPKQFRTNFDTYSEFIHNLCDRYSQVAAKIYEYLGDLRPNLESAQAYENRRLECSRLVDATSKRLHVQIHGCSLLSLEARKAALSRVITD